MKSSTSNNSLNSFRSAWLLSFIGLTLIGCFVYSNTFQSPFYFDDFHNILENTHIRMSRISWDSIKDVLSSPSKNRPFSNLTFALNYYFGQYNVLGYHIVNLMIHIFTGLFLFIFIKDTLQINSPGDFRLSDKKKAGLISFFTALIWLVHPVNSQSVIYIVQRMTSMAAMFYVLSLLCYLKFRLSKLSWESSISPGSSVILKTYPYLGGCFFSGILAMACKETAATLPVFILIYEWFFFKKLNLKWLKKNFLWASVIILFLGMIVLLFLGGNPFNKIESLYVSTLSVQHFTLPQRLLTEIRVLLFYISLFIFPNPSRLHLDYIYPISHSLIDPISTLICLFAVLNLFLITIYTAKKHRILSFCILWFFGNLMIESTFIGLAPIYEHRTYLPFMMLSLMLVMTIYNFSPRQWASIILLGIIACTFSTWTYQRNQIWKDRTAFWLDNIQKSPFNPRPLNAVGNILLTEGKVEKAIEYYHKSLQLKPDYKETYISIGDAYGWIDQFDVASKYYLQGLLFSPDDTEILNKLGNVSVRKKDSAEAIAYYKKALKINPKDAMTYNNLGAAFFYQNNYDLSVKYYLSALEIQSNYPEARINLALALTKLGNIIDAIDQYKLVIHQMPENIEANKNLANLFFSQNNIDGAIHYYQNVLKFAPEDEQVHYNLGIAFYHNKDISSSISHIKEALRINPDYQQAKNALIKLQSLSH